LQGFFILDKEHIAAHPNSPLPPQSDCPAGASPYLRVRPCSFEFLTHFLAGC
jgi:hypothetical protein